MSGHNAAYEMFQDDLVLPDPGDAGTIVFDRYGQIVEMVSAAAETRTLANPSRLGILAFIRMKTSGGDITMTAAGTLNVAANNTAVFADVGDQLVLLSVSATTGYRWEILINTGSCALSTV